MHTFARKNCVEVDMFAFKSAMVYPETKKFIRCSQTAQNPSNLEQGFLSQAFPGFGTCRKFEFRKKFRTQRLERN